MEHYILVCLQALWILLPSFCLANEVNGGDNNFVFDKNFVGVAFSPYVKDWEGDITPQWNSYSTEEIKIMLKVVATKFQHISTYGMGVAWFLDYERAQEAVNKTLEEADSNGKISTAAALLNNETGQLSITVSQGINQVDNVDNSEALQNKEIDYAFLASEEANEIYPGTVWGVTFTNNYVTDSRKGNRLLQIVRDNKARAHAQNLKIGIRINNCIHLTNNGPNSKILEQIILHLDYIMCILHPQNSMVKYGTKHSVTELGKIYFRIEKAIKSIKGDVEVIIGESGWPSQGTSYSDSTNNIENLKAYWMNMGKWAAENKVKVQMFEAFDEPWKSDVKIIDSNNPGGIYGAERHYGWWRRKSNEDMETYIEKILEKEKWLEHAKWGEVDYDPSDGYNVVSIGFVIGGATIFVLLFVIGIALYISRRRSVTMVKTQRLYIPVEKLTDEDIENFKSGFSVENETSNDAYYVFPLTMPYDQTYELEKENFDIDKKKVLGSGHFGMVYKGRIKYISEDVAFKATKSDSSAAIFKSFLSEIKIMTYIGRHENIVTLLGAYTAEIKQGTLYIASEYCQLGNLENFLRNNAPYFLGCQNKRADDCVGVGGGKDSVYKDQAEILSWKCFDMSDLIRWSYEIANAMTHLEEKKVVHADLATRNVLLTLNKRAKLTDFGLSRRIYEYTEYVKKNQEPLPWRWMAIEALGSMTFSSKSDAWSYGVTLWEIFSLATIPYPGLSWSVDFVDDLEKGLRPTCPKYASQFVFQQMSWCWKLNPEDRPNFKICADFFQNLMSNDKFANVSRGHHSTEELSNAGIYENYAEVQSGYLTMQ